MVEPEDYKGQGVNGASGPFVNEGSSPSWNKPEDSEYHYTKSDFESVYSDAHFEPAGASTEPPRYYTPPEKTRRAPRERKKKKSGGAFVRAMCMCLICALLGGAIGAYAVGNRLNNRIDSLETSLAETMKLAQATPAVQSVTVADGSASTLAATQVFNQATRQVVGITTEVTYQNFFGMTSSSAVSGSGFIVSEDGYILTNYHVIEYAYERNLEVSVMLYDGSEYTASIVGVEESNDIAVLKIDASGLTPVTVGNSDSIGVGEKVFAVGNPLGELSFSMSTGYVSGLDRVISTQEAESISMFQIDAAVNPGNSGGPVYNENGDVIGVVTAKYQDTGVEGLGFAIPINDAVSIANDLITKGYVTGKAYMGVRLDERYNSMIAQYYNMPLGAYVYSVDSGSAAEAAGIQAGDIITALGDVKVDSYTGLKQAVRQFSAGETTEISLYRAGESLRLPIVFDEARPTSAVDQVVDF